MKKSNNYSCFADSSLGKVVRNVNVTVLSPFVVHHYPQGKASNLITLALNVGSWCGGAGREGCHTELSRSYTTQVTRQLT